MLLAAGLPVGLSLATESLVAFPRLDPLAVPTALLASVLLRYLARQIVSSSTAVFRVLFARSPLVVRVSCHGSEA